VYDLAGNLLSKTSSTNSLSFGWDGADRCTSIVGPTFQTAIQYDGPAQEQGYYYRKP
jgi:YD repeat-containing protein